MAVLVDYKGLQVASPDPKDPGGLAIQNDFIALADWSPKSAWQQSSDPTTSDDETQDYHPGSMWLRTDIAPPKLFVCQSSAAGAAVWQPVLVEVVQDSTPQLGGNLDVSNHQIVSAGNGNIVLLPDGSGAVGIGTSSPSSTLTVGGAIATPVAPKTAAYTLSATDSVVVCDAAAAAFTITLPTAMGIGGRQYSIKRINAGANNLTVGTTGGQLIDSSAIYVLLSQNDSLTVVSDGSQWRTFGGNSQIDLVKDLTPQLGGDLDVNFKQIVSTSNGNIVLLPNGTGTIGLGTASPNSMLTVGGAIATPVAVKTAAYTLTAVDSVVVCDATAIAFTITLPTAVGIRGRQYSIKRINAGANSVTVQAASGQHIDGYTSYSLVSQNDSLTIVSDGAYWRLVSSKSLFKLVQDATPQLGGNLDVNGGQIVSTSNSNIVLSPNGTGNIVLSPNGTGNVGVGTGGAHSTLTVAGPIATAVKLISSAYTLTAADSVIISDASLSSASVRIPSPVGIAGRQYTVRRIDASTNTAVDVWGWPIDGESYVRLAWQFSSITIVSDGTQWRSLNRRPNDAWAAIGDPTPSYDQTLNFYPGSMWLRTNTTPSKLFICQSSATGAAIWLPILTEVVQDTTPQLGGNLDVNGFAITSASNGNIVLQPNGAGNVLVGSGFAASVLSVGGAIATPVLTTSTAYTLTATNSVVMCNASGAAFTVTLPSAAGISGRQYTIKRTNAGANSVTVGTTGGQLIDGSTTYVLTAQYDSVTVVSDFNNWKTISVKAQFDLIQDTTPQLGGDLDINSKQIVSSSNGHIVLQPNGTGMIGLGTASPNSTLTVGGAIATPVVLKAAAYTLAATDSVIVCDATSAAFTVTLPTAVGISGRQYSIKRINAGVNNVTVGTTSGQLIDGTTTYILTSQNDSLTVVSDGSQWKSISLKAQFELSQDTTPQLGGSLDVNGNQITSTSNGNIVLLPNGTGAVGVGTVSPNSALTVGGAIATSVVSKTAAYTLTVADSIVVCNATSGGFTVTLPTAVGIAGRQYSVKRISAGANNVTIGTTGSQSIDASATYVLSTQNDSLTVISDGAQWRSVSWNPLNSWAQTADPTASNDQTQNYYPGSMWLRTNTTPYKLFVCVSSATGAAVWQPVLIKLVQDTAPQLGGNLDVNGNQIVSAGNNNIVLLPSGIGTGTVGIGTATPNSTLTVGGAIATPVTLKTANYTLTVADSVVVCNATSAAFTATLPTAVGIAGRQYSIKRINAGTNNVTVGTTSGQLIDSNATYVLGTQNSSLTVVSDGSQWRSVVANTGTTVLSSWAQTADPTAGNDQTQNYYPGSMWLRMDTTPPKLFLCQSSATGAAVWQPVLIEVLQDTTPQLGGDLDVNGKQIISAGGGNIVLKPDGAGTVGIAHASPTSTLTVGGSVATAIRKVISNYTASATDHVFICDATTAGFSITLPSAIGAEGRQYIFRRTNIGASKDVTIYPKSGLSQTINGDPSLVLVNANSTATIVSDNANWWSI